ncbi:MAG TPA: winged helix-turn-helix domain-containing protein, partial [Conexibacter sp.]|nr:winged helix-turn-helix domain-containing protein [Conexibacter sp.]
MAARDVDAVDSRVVKALGHPTRVRILNVLRDRELASPVELSNELGVALGTMGYHVRRLEALGFIELARRTQRRGAIEHHYRARDLLDGSDAAEASPPPSPSRGLGAEAAAVAREAQAALASGGFDAVATRADRLCVVLDARGQAALARALPRWQAAVERIAAASETRLARARQPAPHQHQCVAVV